MPHVTLLHNPRCSKSRQALELLEAEGADVRIVRYLDELPSAEQLTEIVSKLGLRPADILRKKEAAYAELGLQARLDDDAALLRAMAEHPILIERPIVIRGTRAIVGRPPERVLEIL